MLPFAIFIVAKVSLLSFFWFCVVKMNTFNSKIFPTRLELLRLVRNFPVKRCSGVKFQHVSINQLINQSWRPQPSSTPGTQSSWLVMQNSSSVLLSVPRSLFRVSTKVALGRPRPLRPCEGSHEPIVHELIQFHQ